MLAHGYAGALAGFLALFVVGFVAMAASRGAVQRRTVGEWTSLALGRRIVFPLAQSAYLVGLALILLPTFWLTRSHAVVTTVGVELLIAFVLGFRRGSAPPAQQQAPPKKGSRVLGYGLLLFAVAQGAVIGILSRSATPAFMLTQLLLIAAGMFIGGRRRGGGVAGA